MGGVLWVFSHQALFLLPPFLQKKRAFKEKLWRIGLVEPHSLPLIHAWFKQEVKNGRIWASCH